jgi:hypothetical protein
MSLAEAQVVLTAGAFFNTLLLAEDVIYVTKDNTTTTIPVIFIEDRNTIISPIESVYVDVQAATILIRVADVPNVEYSSLIRRLDQVWSIREVIRLDAVTWRVNISRTTGDSRPPHRVSSR